MTIVIQHLNPQTAPAELKKPCCGPWVIAAKQAVLSGLLLLLVCNWHSIYEEDQLAKTSQIIPLAAERQLEAPAHHDGLLCEGTAFLGVSLFCRARFLQKVTHLPAVESLRSFQRPVRRDFFRGDATFFAGADSALSQWLAWLVLMNAPLLIITFNYGNEAAFATHADSACRARAGVM